jgi:hypothetical protein
LWRILVGCGNVAWTYGLHTSLLGCSAGDFQETESDYFRFHNPNCRRRSPPREGAPIHPIKERSKAFLRVMCCASVKTRFSVNSPCQFMTP